MIFLDDTDRSFFLWQLREVIERFDWTCRAYCLMGTHILLLHQLGGFAEQHRGLCCPGARRHRLPDAARSSTALQSQVRGWITTMTRSTPRGLRLKRLGPFVAGLGS
jgi:hypothetical protein